MRMKLCLSTLTLVFAVTAAAQPPDPADTAACKGEEASLQQEIDLARSKGQLLRQRELSRTLAALQTRCATLAPAEDRAARIERLREEIRQLRLELDRAQEQLRRLRAEAP